MHLFTLLNDTARLPTKSTSRSAGYDVYTNNMEPVIIPKHSRRILPTGVRVNLQSYTYGQLVSRSGLAANHCIDIGAGVIDSDYMGELKVLMINNGDYEFVVTPHLKCAQLIILPLIVTIGDDIDNDIEYERPVRGTRGGINKIK